MTKITAKVIYCVSYIPREKVNEDAFRAISAAQVADTDTDISACVAYHADADTQRDMWQKCVANADTFRVGIYIGRVNHDTIRRVPFRADDTGTDVISVSIGLQERTLSDTFSMQTIYPVGIGDAIDGSLLDFAYQYLAEETSQHGDIIRVKGMYDIDKLLYTPFLYIASKADSALAHARRLAAGLDKSLTASFDDFYPTSNYSSAGATYQNIISGLFGWTDRLPQRSINVFLRGDTLCIIQRGMEPNTFDLSAIIAAHKTSVPNVDRKRVRSTWFATAGDNSGNATDEATSDDDTRTPFTGTISFDDQSCSYVLGMLQTEVHGSETTTYSYTSCDGVNMYVSGSVKETSEVTVTTEYRYGVLPNDLYLATEIETTVNKNDQSDKSERVTRHHPVGNGWYGTSVEIDGEFQGSSLSQGKPGQKVSLYTVEQAGLSMQTKSRTKNNGALQGRALVDTEFPVRGINMLRALTEAIEWLDRKVQETVSMDIWACDHVIDFTDSILYNGATYYLVSNNIEKTTREMKQSITIVRWY